MKPVFPITFNIDFNAVVDLFCNLLPIALLQDNNATCVITGDTDIELTGAGGAGPAFCVTGLTVADPLGGKVWFEYTIDGASEPDSGGGVAINLFPSGGAPEEVASFLVFPNFGGVAQAFLISEFGPPPYSAIAGFTNFNLGAAPYTVQYRLDTTTGEVSYEDTAGNAGQLVVSLASIIGAPFTIAPINLGFDGTTNPVVSSKINVGYSAPVIDPPVGYDTYCSYLPPPAPIQCAELIGLTPHFLLGQNANVPSGVQVSSFDKAFNFLNTGSNAQGTFLAGPLNYNLFSTPAFAELTYDGASIASNDNALAAFWATIFGGFFPIGAGMSVKPRLGVGDGSLYFFGGLLPPLWVLGSKLIINDFGGLRADEFVLTWVSGDSGDLNELGFEFQESVAGSGVSDSELSAEGEFIPADYSVTPLIFNVQLGANPAVLVTLTGDEDSMSVIAASIQSQLQAAGGAYTAVQVTDGVGMSIVDGYNIVIGADFSALTIAYEDSLGNNDVVSIADAFTKLGGAGFEGVLQLYPINHFLFGQAARFEFPATFHSIDISYNAGKYFPAIDLGAQYRPHCQLTEYVFPYGMTAPPFSSSQGINSVIGRLATVTNDTGESHGPAAVGVFRDFVGQPTTFEGNTFEARLTTLDAGSFEEQWEIGLNATLQEDIRMAREVAGFNVNPSNLLKITAQFPSSINHVLANNMPDFVLDDVMAICVFPNLLADPTPNADKQPQVQFILKVGSDVVIYDRLYVNRADGSPVYAFTMLGDITGAINDNLPDLATAEVTFNGIEADYLLTNYPDGVVDYKGDSMVTKTDPWIRSAVFAPWNIEQDSNFGGTIVYSNSDKTIAITSDGANINGVKAHLPLFLPSRTLASDVFVVGMRVDVAPVGAEFELTCTIAQSNNSNDIIRIYQAGPDLRVDTSSGLFGLGTHTLVAGDEIYLEFETGLDSFVNAYLWDGVSVTTTPIDSVYFNASLYESFIVQMETKNVPVSTTSQFTSLCKAADIDVGGNITFKAGAIDIEGVLI